MNLTVLGKYGPYPAAGGGTSSYIIESKKTRVNLDFGSGAIGSTLEAVGKLPNTIVLSHLHFDHTSDLLPLAYALKEPVPVYLPFDGSPISEIVSALAVFTPVKIYDGMTTRIGDLTFEFVRLPHPAESYGMKISDGKASFFYSGDTMYDRRIAEKMRGCKLALLDASVPAAHSEGKPHMSIAEARKLSNETGVRVLLTHVHPEFSPVDEALQAGLEIAEEMKIYEI